MIAIITVPDIVSLTSVGVATLILVILGIRVRSLTVQLSQPPPRPPISQEAPSDISDAIVELMDLRLKREALSHMIARAYELTSRGELSDEIKDMIVSKASEELRRVEERVSILEKYEELDRLLKEKDELEREFKDKLDDISGRIEKLREALAISVEEVAEKEEEKPEKVEKPKVKKERRPRKPRELDELMRELEKILKEEEE